MPQTLPYKGCGSVLTPASQMLGHCHHLFFPPIFSLQMPKTVMKEFLEVSLASPGVL